MILGRPGPMILALEARGLAMGLPGSTKGVKECLDVVLPVLPHALELLQRESVPDHHRENHRSYPTHLTRRSLSGLSN